MSDLIATLRAIVRDEIARLHLAEVGSVTQVHAREGESGKENHQVGVRLRGSGVELPRVPVLVGRLGLSALPNEGDLVLVTFEDGDLNAPFVVGCLYDDRAHPPAAKAHELVYQPPDPGESGVRRLHVELSNGSTLTLDDDALKVALGGASFEVNRDGDIVIETSGAIRLKASGDIELDAQGDLKAKAGAKLEAKGAVTAALEGNTQVKVKGAQVAVAGITQFSAA